jgi:uncharacterized radical SAM superfamily protein
MNKEIKEILDDLRKTADNSIFIVCSSQEELDKMPKYTTNFLSINDRKAKLLLDYITNLEQESKKLKEIVENLTTLTVCGDRKQIKNTAQYKLEQAQQRIDKAIEYIKNNNLYEETRLDYDIDDEPFYWDCDDNKAKNDLLDILRGKE